MQTEPAAVGKKKKKKKGKGKANEASESTNGPYYTSRYGVEDDEDDVGAVDGYENDHARIGPDSELDSTQHPIQPTAPLAATGQTGLRMSTTATAQAELLAAANELYKRMETEQLANDSNDGEYWKQLPSHIRSFVETTYAQGASLSPNERSKSQAMLALAQTMVDEATSRFPSAAGGFPPPFDPSILSDPKFAERLAMKHGAMNIMQHYDDAYDDISDDDDDDLEDEQPYEVDDSSKRRKSKKKKKGAAATGTVDGVQTSPLPPVIPSAPNPAPAITRAAPSVAQPRPSSRAAGKQPVYSQPSAPPTRTNRSSATKSPAPPNPYNHGYPKTASTNGNSSLTKRPTGGGDGGTKSKLWSNSTEEERERIKEFWLGLSEAERRDLVKLEKEAVLKKMKEQQKHSCSCAVCGRKRHAIEEELEVLYDAYYEELEQYANHQQRYQSSGGKIPPPPGPGPFPGSIAIDKNGTLIGGPPGATKHPSRGGRPMLANARGRKTAPDSEDYDDDEYDDEDEYEDEEDEEEDEDEEDEDDDPNTRKLASRGRVTSSRGPVSRRAKGRDDFFNFSSLTAAGPGNILTVADDLLKNDGGKFLEMMEQLAERRMQRDEEAAKEVEMDSDDLEDDQELSEEDDEDDGEDDEDSEEDVEDMSEEQKMEEGRKMFSIFAARMFEQRVLNAYREKVAAERQQQLLRELEDEDKIQAERDAKRQKENQKKKDKKKQQKLAKEAEKAKKEAEKAAEEAAARAKQEALEEAARKRREEEARKREQERKQKEEEKARQAEERRQRIAEQKAQEAERKREREERERKERAARQEKEAIAKAEKLEREKKAKEERLLREAKEREEKEKREREEKERREKERLEQLKAEERKKQEAAANAAKAKQNGSSISPKSATFPASVSSQQAKKLVNVPKPSSSAAPPQRPPSGTSNRPPPLLQQQQPTQPIPAAAQRPMSQPPQPPLPLNMQLPPNMVPPMGMFNPITSPSAMSPRAPYLPNGAPGQAPSQFNPLAQFPQMANSTALNGPMIGSAPPFPFDAQTPMMSPPPNSAVPLQSPRAPAALPPGLSIPVLSPSNPLTNGITPIGVPPGPSGPVNPIRRASTQVNPSPFGAIGKPAFPRVGIPSSSAPSQADEEERAPSSTVLTRPSPPSPTHVLGSSALVDENDTIVELPKRRGTASWGDAIGAPAAIGSRWGRTPAPSWQTPSPVGSPWSTAPGRPQAGHIDSSYLPS